MLAEDFHGHGALAGDHFRVVVGMDVDEALLFHQLQRISQGLGEGVAVQHHLAAAGAHALHLEIGGGARHHDGGLDTQLAGRQGHTLGMVAGRSGDHPARQLLRGKLGDLVVGAANLEGVDRLQVLALEEDLVAQALGELAGGLQGGFHRDVVNARGQGLLHIFFEHLGFTGGHFTGGRSLPQGFVGRPHGLRGLAAIIRALDTPPFGPPA
ncbi:hypothetical protein D9M69_484880 [compost metagenome]